MVHRLRATVPWLLVAASVLFAALLLYVFFSGYLPARHRVSRLEVELRDLYAREAQLHTQIAVLEERARQRTQELLALHAERNLLARRLEEVERDLALARRRR